MRKTAFTLAEVLITLGIIGVVAAMTMPSLINTYKEKALINSAKKTLSVIQNAMIMARSRIEASSNGEIFVSSNTNDQTADLIFKELQVVERCPANTNGCGGAKHKIKQQYKRNNGYGIIAPASDIRYYSRAVLKDGSIVGITQTKYPSGMCQNYFKKYDTDANGNYILDSEGNRTGEKLVPEVDCGHILFDTNGLKKPNQFGRDAFLIYVVPNGYIQSSGQINNMMKDDKLYFENFPDSGSFN